METDEGTRHFNGRRQSHFAAERYMPVGQFVPRRFLFGLSGQHKTPRRKLPLHATSDPWEDVMLHGECLCGACRYEVPDEFEYAMNCHCSQCRRATGSAFKPFGGIKIDLVRIVAGDGDMIRHGDESAYDVICRKCGSLLFSSVREHQYAHVTYGTLMQAPTLLPAVHIFVASKAQWYEIRDDLPQFDEFPG